MITTNARQPGFARNSSCQANLISFFEEAQSLVDKGNVFVRHLTFCMAFDLVPKRHSNIKKIPLYIICNTHTFNGLKAG